MYFIGGIKRRRGTRLLLKLVEASEEVVVLHLRGLKDTSFIRFVK